MNAVKPIPKSTIKICPMCGNKRDSLTHIDSGMRLRLQEEGQSISHEAVCDPCFKSVSTKVTNVAQKRVNDTAHTAAQNEMWKGRIRLIKEGRQHMEHSDFASAAVAYEKYIKILEIVYQKPLAQLTPQDFQDRSKEVTVISSCLWDLLRIYDGHPSYIERQNQVGQKLAEFLRFSPLFPVIIRKAEIEIRKCENPAAYRQFLKKSDAERPRCLVATAAFSSGSHPTVLKLRLFRDIKLKKHPVGRKFIAFYYRKSPIWAKMLGKNNFIKSLLRPILSALAAFLAFIFQL